MKLLVVEDEIDLARALRRTLEEEDFAVDLALDGMTCAACAARIETTLNRLPGVRASVNFATAPGSAVAGTDYVTTNGVLVIPAGSTKVTSKPGSRGITEIDSWLPSVSGLISNDPRAAGAGPRDGPWARNTNGKL